MKGLLAIAAGLMLVTGMRAQEPSQFDAGPVGTTGTVADAPAAPPAGSPVFRSAVDLVALNVVVTDPREHLVGGLSSADFAVYEDGVRQEVSFFAASNVALDLAILLDTSASMSDKMGIMQRAALGFAETLRPGDRAMIVDIKDGTKILHRLDDDPGEVARAIRGTRSGGGTGLYNGLYLTLKQLAKARSAGEDMRRFSETQLEKYEQRLMQ